MLSKDTNGPQARAECGTSNSKPDVSLILGSQSILPVNLSAERCVLGAVIEDDSFLPDLIGLGLQASDFFVGDHRRIFEAIAALHANKVPIDYVTVVEHLGNTQDGYVLIAGLIQGVVLHQGHILHHAAIVRKKARLRRLLKLAEWIGQAVTETADPDLLVAEIRDCLELCSEDELRA